jgi:hypothetical protein
MPSTRISRTVNGSIANAFAAKAETIAAVISFGMNNGDVRAVRDFIDELLYVSVRWLSDQPIDIVEYRNSH